MAPTDYDFNLTRNEIIEGALRIVGALGPGQTLSGDRLVTANEALNLLVKEWQAEGVFLWQSKVATETAVVSQASYTLGNDILAVDNVWYNDGNTDIPVALIPWNEYQSTYDKDDESNSPVYAAVDHHPTTLSLYLWPVPNTAYTIRYQYIERLKDMDTAAGNAPVPQHWLRALKYGLAAELMDEYRKTLQERKYISDKAEVLFLKAKRSNIERADNEAICGTYQYRRR